MDLTYPKEAQLVKIRDKSFIKSIPTARSELAEILKLSVVVIPR